MRSTRTVKVPGGEVWKAKNAESGLGMSHQVLFILNIQESRAPFRAFDYFKCNINANLSMQ